MREGFTFARMECGEQFVMIAGAQTMQLLFADNLDMQELVVRNVFVHNPV